MAWQWAVSFLQYLFVLVSATILASNPVDVGNGSHFESSDEQSGPADLRDGYQIPPFESVMDDTTVLLTQD